MRSSLLDEIGEDYVTTARAKGLRDVQVRNRHAVRNALLPTTTVTALSFGFVVTGAITVETVFSIPGLGLLATEALSVPDYWVLQGTLLVSTAAVIFANLAANLVLRPARPAGADVSAASEAGPGAADGTAGHAGSAGARRGAGTGRSSGRTGRAWPVWSILGGFVFVALVGPGDRRRRGPEAQRCHRRRARAAVEGVLARDRRQGAVGADAADLGHPGLAAGRAARHRDLDGDRHLDRAAVRLLRGPDRARCSSG